MPNKLTIEGLAPDIETLLAAYGITAPERPLSHDGYSGAKITLIEQGGERYVVKRVRTADDWIMRVVGDTQSREAQIAASSLPAQLPDSIRMPTLGAARDRDGWALLMRDITPLLLTDEGPTVAADALDRVLGAMADLHARFWGSHIEGHGVDFMAPDQWLGLLSPRTGEQLAREGRDFGVVRGWALFDETAPPAASALVQRLHRDAAPLLDLLRTLPKALLHGDFKFGNVGLDAEAVWLIDWAMSMHAPPAIELAWFLAANSSRLPCSLDETIELYRAALAERLGRARFAEARWDVQRGVVAIWGLLVYGWGKALDAEAGRPDELRWWCGRAIEAACELGWD